MEKNDKSTENPKTVTLKKPIKKKKSDNSEFKKKYFEYYDDIKISHREDW